MTKYQELIADLKVVDSSQAERMEEEIDIMLHKLKFLPRENFPKTVLLNQSSAFNPIVSRLLEEKVKISGGQYITDLKDNPQVIILIQETENLYAEISSLLQEELIKSSDAYTNNRIYIIHNKTFNQDDASYLQDLEILSEIIQPKFFYFDRNGKDWVQFDMQ